MSHLVFEVLQSNDGLVAKRARVPSGWIYLFQSIPGVTAPAEQGPCATSCFVPDQHPGAGAVRLSADDLHTLSRGR